MKITAVRKFLSALVENDIMLSTMIWGPPGVGKSSVVAQVARSAGLNLTDLRLSQLAPTDLRGLPVPLAGDTPDEGRSVWYPPEFLPQDGRGILLLDEINMAPPAMQGIAQQLILDRKVGSYSAPDGWFIWAAGNRKEDRASVFEMPAPLANRFLHLEVKPDFGAFKDYALEAGMHEQVLAFLSFRPTLLHKPDTQSPNWPSPRSWEMASRLHEANLGIEPAVGKAASGEFNAFLKIYRALPQLDDILSGKGSGIPFPEEPSARYAITIGLTMRAAEAENAMHAFRWLTAVANAEWVQLFGTDLIRRMRTKKQMGVLAKLIKSEPQLQKFLKGYRELLGL
jgi:MoxR-like ATPase